MFFYYIYKNTNFMPLIKQVNGSTPNLGSNVFLADNSTLVGDVSIGDNSSIWFNTVIRGDVNPIIIGKNVNVQDGVVIHCTYNKTSTIIGDNVSIGHNAIIHGCSIANNVLIGMGAIIMDNVIIESDVIIGAGSIVPEGKVLESGFIYLGSPAISHKKLNTSQISDMNRSVSDNYIKYAEWFK